MELLLENKIELDLSNKKLTNWVNEPSVLALKDDFNSSKSFHDSQMQKIQEWEDILFTSGSEEKYLPKEGQLRSRVQPKLVRKQNEWRYPALTEPFLNSDKIFTVSPRTFEDVNAARQNEILLNYQFDTKINKVKFIDELVHSAVDRGTAIVRLGWKRETKNVQKPVGVFEYYPADPTNQEYGQLLQQAIQLKETNPREFNLQPEEVQEAVNYYLETNVPVQVAKVGEQLVTVQEIVENCPCVELVDPRNVYIDPSCNGDATKALFIIESFETNKAELLKSGNYVNLDNINWTGYSKDTLHTSTTPDEFNFNDTSRKKVIAYEYWGYYDINNNGTLVPIVATWIDNILIRMELNPFPDNKLPFVFINYSTVLNSVYGEPDAEMLKDNQRILGALTRGMVDTLGRSANGQAGFAKGMLDITNKRKFNSGENYEFDPTMNPLNNYIQHTYPELPQSAFLMLNLQNTEAEALTGVKAFNGGLSGDAYGQVAAGIRGMLDAAAKREMSILRRLAKGVSDIGNKIIAMNAEFLSEEEVIRITNEKFITITKEDIKGNFDLKVDINTAEVDNAKAQDLAFMLQTIGPNLDTKLMLNILSEIAELKRMPKLANDLKNYQPQPDPHQEQLKQLELLKLQSEIAYNQARAEKYKADTQNVAVNTQQTADGTKFSQEIQKQKAQAQANQNLEITKALTKQPEPIHNTDNIEAAIGYNQLSKQL